MRRVAQIGAGKILGGCDFVTAWITSFGDRFAGRPTARAVAGTAFATHGWKLAKANAA